MMDNEIPFWFWMIIVAGLSGMLGFIMYHFSMLLREMTLTTREFRYVVVELHDIIDSTKMLLEKANRIVDTITSTVETISSTIVKPLLVLGTALNAVKGMVSRFTGEDLDEE